MKNIILNLDFILCDLGTAYHCCIKAVCSAPVSMPMFLSCPTNTLSDVFDIGP